MSTAKRDGPGHPFSMFSTFAAKLQNIFSGLLLWVKIANSNRLEFGYIQALHSLIFVNMHVKNTVIEFRVK